MKPVVAIRHALPGLLVFVASLGAMASAPLWAAPARHEPLSMAGPIAAADPRQLLAFVRAYGRASLDTDRDGDPHIKGRLDGQDYQIFFYGCRRHEDCTEIQLIALWPGKHPALARVNRWNAEKRVGRVYLSPEGGLVVDVDVAMDGGIPRAALDDAFDGFRHAMSQLGGWPDGASDDAPETPPADSDDDNASKPNVVI